MEETTKVNADTDIAGFYSNGVGKVETIRNGDQLSLEVTFSFPRETHSKTIELTNSIETTTHPLRQVDDAGRVFQVVNPDRVVKGSITYFSNPQGSFMRIGQTIFRKAGV